MQKKSVEYALNQGQQKNLMVASPGNIMGYLAYGHPFLDGNGRTIMIIHAELAEHAGISINWASSSKKDYLSALTNEIADPNRGTLDAYLSNLIAPSLGREKLVGHVSTIEGLRSGFGDIDTGQIVAGQISDPKITDRYKVIRTQRRDYRGVGNLKS